MDIPGESVSEIVREFDMRRKELGVLRESDLVSVSVREAHNCMYPSLRGEEDKLAAVIATFVHWGEE